METKTHNKYLLIWILKCWNYIINFYGVEELVQLIILHQSTAAEGPCVKPDLKGLNCPKGEAKTPEQSSRIQPQYRGHVYLPCTLHSPGLEGFTLEVTPLC